MAVHTRYIQNTRRCAPRGFMLNVYEIIHQVPMPLLFDSGLTVDCMILLHFFFLRIFSLKAEALLPCNGYEV